MAFWSSFEYKNR